MCEHGRCTRQPRNARTRVLDGLARHTRPRCLSDVAASRASRERCPPSRRAVADQQDRRSQRQRGWHPRGNPRLRRFRGNGSRPVMIRTQWAPRRSLRVEASRGDRHPRGRDDWHGTWNAVSEPTGPIARRPTTEMPCVAVHPRSSVLQALGSAHGRLITGDFRDSRPPRRPEFTRSASVAYEPVHFGLGNCEPETNRGARSLDARRDNPRARPRRSASTSANPLRWPTARDLRARNPLSQNAVRTPQNANAPAGRPGRSLLTCRRASFARARQMHAAFGR